ncbi:MAG: Unknown protein [uncultured Thiotrichaceae bacterium]|uniref:Uncharacterized protein n=1 Tax=uncultured Thiotrichaceae bacterium TaxID=298394 RepID=A0A6S6UE81_9GAMM|nr:MAG: Unknown protein [uncultured Thiotrichaceae bacterium]
MSKNQYDDNLDDDFISTEDDALLNEIENEPYFEKSATKRKQNKIKKMRRIKQGLYDYFEKKSLRENDCYYD